MYAPRVLNITATKQPNQLGQATQVPVNQSTTPNQVANQTIQQTDKSTLPNTLPFKSPANNQPPPVQGSQWQSGNYNPGQQADVSANSAGWGQQYHGNAAPQASVLGYGASHPQTIAPNQFGYNTPASSNRGPLNGAHLAATNPPLVQGNNQGNNQNQGQAGPHVDTSKRYYSSDQNSQNNQNNQSQQTGQGLTTQNQQQQQQDPTQIGSVVNKENYREQIATGQWKHITTPDGKQGYYDPVTHTTYRDDGNGNLTVIMDKKGYNEDGSEQVGASPENQVGVTSDGRPIYRNPDTGHYWTYDGKGGYTPSDMMGNAIGPDGKVTQAPDAGKSALDTYDQYVKNNPPPQFDQSKIDNLVQAQRNQRALQGGQDARSILALGANSGVNPDVTQAALSGSSAQLNAQGAQQDAKLQLQGEMTKLQTAQDYWNQRAEAAKMALSYALSQNDKDRALREMILAETQGNANKKQLMAYQHQLDTMDIGSVIASGLFGLAGHAVGGLLGNSGLFSNGEG